MADRDLGPRLPQIELADLPRPIDRALKRPRRVKQRPHLPQVVIDDRLAAIKAQRSDQLPDPLPRHPRVGLQQPVDLVLERIQLRRRRRPPIIRRRRCPQRCPDRVARHPRPPRKLPDRNAADEVLATQLSPALHVQQAPSTPNSITKTKPGSPAIRTPPPPPEGGQLSTGGGGSVFTRRRQKAKAPRVGQGRTGPRQSLGHTGRYLVRVASWCCFPLCGGSSAPRTNVPEPFASGDHGSRYDGTAGAFAACVRMC